MEKCRIRNGVMIALVVGLFVGIAMMLPTDPPDPLQPPAVASPESDGDRLLAELRPPAGQPESEGTAIAILVDTSGSMKSSVRDLDGALRPKLEIAKRATRRLLEKLKEFTVKNPQKMLAVGLYEFSGGSCRRLLPLGRFDFDQAARTVEGMKPGKGTPIGEAMILGKQDLDRSGLSQKHLLLVTDGENTQGRDPVLVARAMARLAPYEQAGIHFIAFDVAASKFNGIREAGGTVLGAASAAELDQSLDFILDRKILLEMPEPPRHPAAVPQE